MFLSIKFEEEDEKKGGGGDARTHSIIKIKPQMSSLIICDFSIMDIWVSVEIYKHHNNSLIFVTNLW
jgi:hypothetical protein